MAQVDGVPVETTRVVPQSGNGRRRLLESLKSLFSVTIIAPSTPGVHTITGALLAAAHYASECVGVTGSLLDYPSDTTLAKQHGLCASSLKECPTAVIFTSSAHPLQEGSGSRDQVLDRMQLPRSWLLKAFP